ncbi:MAG: hypothetical protein EZS28_048955, partial [Streblomastix strix]
MTDIQDTISLLRKGDQMCTQGVSSIFNHIRVNQQQQQYITFWIHAISYTQVGMLFGINIAPYTFALVIESFVICLPTLSSHQSSTIL